jgi:hypothetical protein
VKPTKRPISLDKLADAGQLCVRFRSICGCGMFERHSIRGQVKRWNFCNCRKSGLCRRTTACVRRYSDATFYRYFDLVRLKHRLSDHCQNMLALDRSSNHGPEAHGTAPSQDRLTRFPNAESMRVRKHPLHRTCRFQTSSRLRRMINCTIRST